MRINKDSELVKRVAERQNKGGTAAPYEPPPAAYEHPGKINNLLVAIVQCPCGNKLGVAERMGVNNTSCPCGRVYTMQRLGERI